MHNVELILPKNENLIKEAVTVLFSWLAFANLFKLKSFS